MEFRRMLGYLALAAVAVLAAGCGSTVATTSGGSAKLADFHNQFVEFRYPTAWAAAEPDVATTLHFHPIVYLSAQPTGNPCRTTGSETACTWPIRHLRAGGVLIVWENRGYPGWTLRSMPGRPLRVGGRPARLHVSHPGICRAIGADETVEVAIARPLNGNWTALTACLRRPNVAANEREVDALLASTRFNTP